MFVAVFSTSPSVMLRYDGSDVSIYIAEVSGRHGLSILMPEWAGTYPCGLADLVQPDRDVERHDGGSGNTSEISKLLRLLHVADGVVEVTLDAHVDVRARAGSQTTGQIVALAAVTGPPGDRGPTTLSTGVAVAGGTPRTRPQPAPFRPETESTGDLERRVCDTTRHTFWAGRQLSAGDSG